MSLSAKLGLMHTDLAIFSWWTISRARTRVCHGIFEITTRLCHAVGSLLPSFVVSGCWVSGVNLIVWQWLKGCGWLLCKLARWQTLVVCCAAYGLLYVGTNEATYCHMLLCAQRLTVYSVYGWVCWNCTISMKHNVPLHLSHSKAYFFTEPVLWLYSYK